MILVAMRLMLARAATVSTQKIALGWDLTKGQVWPMFVAFLLMALALFALAMLAVVPIVTLVAGLSLSSGQLISQHRSAAVSALLISVVVAFGQIPLQIGLEAFFYRGMRAPPAA